MGGVSFDSKRNRYVARPSVNGKKVYLGRFETPQEAELAIGLYKGKLESLRDDFSFKLDELVKPTWQMEETKSTSVFTRLKGFRLRKHKVEN